MIRLALICAALAALGGCLRFSQSGAEQPAPGGLGAELATLGTWFLWIGAGATVVGLAGRAAFTVATLAPVGAALSRIPIIGGIVQAACAFVASIGALAFAVGCASIWLADNLWAFWLSCLAAALAVAWVHRRSIRRWLGIRAAEVKP